MIALAGLAKYDTWGPVRGCAGTPTGANCGCPSCCSVLGCLCFHTQIKGESDVSVSNLHTLCTRAALR